MTAIQFGTMQTRVMLACDNMASNDPWATYVPDHLNEAANAIILMSLASDKKNMNLFPELRNRRWEAVTVAGTGYVDKPDAALLVDSVTLTRNAVQYNPSTHTEYPMYEETDQARFGTLDKTATGWPTRWCEASTSILIHPTPTAAYLTRLVIRGMRKEDALTVSADEYQMNEMFHPVIIDYATYLTMLRMGWNDEADKMLIACEKRLTQVIDLLGLQNKRNRTRITIAGSL